MLATVIEVPVSQNASAGQMVEFSCATDNSQEIITWNTMPHIPQPHTKKMSLPAGGKRSVFMITAVNNTHVMCIVTDTNTANGMINTALLLVQGI